MRTNSVAPARAFARFHDRISCNVLCAYGSFIEIGLWAILFVFCEKFQGLETACYHSAINYTTLGYGDLIMTPSWRLLGPLEAADVMLMFGVSTAIIFAVIQGLVRARFADLSR